MANVQTDFAVGNGTFVARATDADGNAAVTVTLADPGDGGRNRIYGIYASCTGGTSALDANIIVRLDNSATNFRTFLGAARGGLAALPFFEHPLIGLKSTAVPIILSALGSGVIGELEVIYDVSG